MKFKWTRLLQQQLAMKVPTVAENICMQAWNVQTNLSPNPDQLKKPSPTYNSGVQWEMDFLCDRWEVHNITSCYRWRKSEASSKCSWVVFVCGLQKQVPCKFEVVNFGDLEIYCHYKARPIRHFWADTYVFHLSLPITDSYIFALLKPQLIDITVQFFFSMYVTVNHHSVYRIISIVSRGLSSLSSFHAAYNQWWLTFLYFLALLKGIDDAQSFLEYVLSTKVSFHVRFSSASRAHPSQGGLWWTQESCSGVSITTRVANKCETC